MLLAGSKHKNSGFEKSRKDHVALEIECYSFKNNNNNNNNNNCGDNMLLFVAPEQQMAF
jgi:hypothetical protein